MKSLQASPTSTRIQKDEIILSDAFVLASPPPFAKNPRKQIALFFVDWHTARAFPSILRIQRFPDSFLSFVVGFLLCSFFLLTCFTLQRVSSFFVLVEVVAIEILVSTNASVLACVPLGVSRGASFRLTIFAHKASLVFQRMFQDVLIEFTLPLRGRARLALVRLVFRGASAAHLRGAREIGRPLALFTLLANVARRATEVCISGMVLMKLRSWESVSVFPFPANVSRWGRACPTLLGVRHEAAGVCFLFFAGCASVARLAAKDPCSPPIRKGAVVKIGL